MNLCFIFSFYHFALSVSQEYDCSVLSQHPSCSLLPSSTECGPVELDTRIVGGNDASLGQYPWIVVIRDKASLGFCGGALISTRYILTAAHCVADYQLDKDRPLPLVKIGEYDLSTSTDCVDQQCAPPQLEVEVEGTVMHDEYDKTGNIENDIGLLRLAKDIRFNDYVKPICLPMSKYFSNNTLEDERLNVAGWGIYKENGPLRYLPHKLQTLEVAVKDLSTCQKMYSIYQKELSPKQICAGGVLGQDSCDGDSGGPLMGIFNDDSEGLGYFVVGVVSFGPKVCSKTSVPGIYTRISEYTDWILNSMKP